MISGVKFMKQTSAFSRAAIAGAVMLTSSLAYGEDFNLEFGGFVRGKIGSGDRYGNAQGEDTLGISKAAITAKSSYENVDFNLLVGGRKMSHSEFDQSQLPARTADTNSIDLSEAYVTVNNVRETAFSFSIGMQPLNLGLKPSGFAGDRSITGGVEYGAPANGSPRVFAYSNQVEASLIGVFDFSEYTNISFGLFDIENTATTATDGPSIFDNYFLQLRADELLMEKLYFVLGMESRYSAFSASSETGFDIGIGFNSDLFDISLEYISLNKGYFGTTGDEAITVVELTLFLFENASIYLDYSSASELDVDTIRFGTQVNMSDAFSLQLEYATDDAAVSTADADSIDLRVEYSF